MKKIIKWFKFDADGKYHFDWADITSILYVVCVCGIIMGYNMTPMFVCVCVLSLITCISARKLNLIIINLAFVVLNLFYLLG